MWRNFHKFFNYHHWPKLVEFLHIYSYLFFLIFQGTQKSGGQVNKVAEEFSMGGCVGAKQNSLDPLENGVLAKRRWRFGGQRYQFV